MASFTNKATLTYNGLTVASNTVSGEIAEALTVSKTVLTATYGEQPLTFIVSLVNGGATALSGLTLVDDLGAYPVGEQTVYPFSCVADSVKYLQNGELQPDPATDVSAGLKIEGIGVPAGGSAVIVYSVEPTQFAPRAAGEGVTNTVTATGGGLVEPVSAQATVTADPAARLTIVKSVSPAAVADNGVLTYTFVIENSGASAADAQANVVISDLFNPILSALSVTLDGAPLSSGTGYVYDAASGQFDTVAGVITVPAAQFDQNPETGAYTVLPGSATLVVSGTV